MIIAIPSMDRWENNPIYKNLISFSTFKDAFIFFVRKEQYELYKKNLPEAIIVAIEEDVHNIGETRRYIDKYMRKLGADFYAQMDDRVSLLSYIQFYNRMPCISGKSYCETHIDAMRARLEEISQAIFRRYPDCALLSVRPRGFANGVTPDCVVELNGNISQIDDILIVNTKYPLENLPETDEYFEDCNYAISAISKGHSVGVIQILTKSTVENFPSRCFSNKTEKDDKIRNNLYPLLCKKYDCGTYTKLTEGKDGHPVLKLVHKNAPVKRIKISQSELEELINEYCY